MMTGLAPDDHTINESEHRNGDQENDLGDGGAIEGEQMAQSILEHHFESAMKCRMSQFHMDDNI